jgi:hypothetical protein
VVQIVNSKFDDGEIKHDQVEFESWGMIRRISIPVDPLLKERDAIGQVADLVKDGDFPSIVAVQFSADAIHVAR